MLVSAPDISGRVRFAVEEPVVAVEVTPVTEQVHLGVAAHRQHEVPGRPETVALRAAPGLGERVARIGAVRAYLRDSAVDRVLRTRRLEAADQLLVVGPLTAQVDEATVAERETEVARDLDRGLVFFHELAVLRLEATTFVVIAQDEVDDTRDRVGAVLRRCTVAQNFDTLQCDARDRSHIGRVGTGTHGRAEEPGSAPNDGGVCR